MASKQLFIFAFLLVLLIVEKTSGYKWETIAGMANVEPVTMEGDCERLKFLTRQQRKICQKYVDFMEAVREGAREALDECKYQFRNMRWNCSFFDQKDLFGGLLKTGTKETAFVYSILSAGVTQSVARACSSGKLKKCGCDRTLNGNEGDFEWTGCSDNVAYGSAFTLKLLDVREHLRKKVLIPRALMNLHNNNIGRKAVERNMRIQCKCHGVSGSCEVKTCWKTLPDFRTVGNELKSRYDRSTKVIVEKAGSHTELIPSRNGWHDDGIGGMEYASAKDKILTGGNFNSNNNNGGGKNGGRGRSNAGRRKSKGRKQNGLNVSTVDSYGIQSTTNAIVTSTSSPLSDDHFIKIAPQSSMTRSSNTQKIGNRFKRLTVDEIDVQQKQNKKNKVWIFHGRDTINRREDQRQDKHHVGKNDNGNKMEDVKAEADASIRRTPNDQELIRYPRMPMDFETDLGKEKNFYGLQNRRNREEMEQRRQLQRKRRERIIRRQRQQQEAERIETTAISRRRQEHFAKGNHQTRSVAVNFPVNNNNNNYNLNHNDDEAKTHFRSSSSTIFLQNKSLSAKDDSFDDQIVFLDPSPDYCDLDPRTGSLGTSGRTCSIDGTEGNCGNLCCGRGYSVKRSVVTERCNCRFQWCCEVKCQKCRREVVQYTCR